jgi:hypothetical protein
MTVLLLYVSKHQLHLSLLLLRQPWHVRINSLEAGSALVRQDISAAIGTKVKDSKSPTAFMPTCCRVHQVCCCPKSCEGLVTHWQRPTHWNVTPLLLMNLKAAAATA